MQNKKLLLFLIIITVALASTKLFQFLTPSAPIPTPTPISFLPTPTLAPIVTLPPPQSFSLNNILSQLPIITPAYTIQYDSKSNEFIVIVLKNPYEENKTTVKNWFKSQGVEDLSKINIYFITARGVAP